ncbi:MAG: hypothetical protein Q7S93_04820 [Phenylobacterium sp.]|uniref:hypothetical protein n=1 Tax=Phenylobacterium sp. TaxID=1871053 RepID=UPI00271B7957|nr:hypothetical protein [Phenylobacterium sp.]MDO8409364.1 hypothetical protein [Phenylobacterium sp.]
MTPSRRAFLPLLIAAPLAASPALAGAAPDAALIRRAARLARLSAALAKAEAAADAAEAAALRDRPPVPEALRRRKGDRWFIAPHRQPVGAPYDAHQVARWSESLTDGRASALMSPGLVAEFVGRGREIIAAAEAHQLALEASDHRHDVAALCRRADRLGAAKARAEAALWATPAKTLTGLKVKAGHLADQLARDPASSASLAGARSLADDLQRLTTFTA